MLSVNYPKAIVAKWIPQFAGPWRPIIERIENGSAMYTLPKTVKFSSKAFFTPSRYDQLQYAWGHFYMAIPFSDGLHVDTRIAQWSNNQWKNNAFIIKFDSVCSTLITHMKWVPDMIFGKGNYSKCPIPASGLVEMTNKTIHPEFPAVPIFPYGVWRYTFAIFKGNTLLGATDTVFQAVPKL